MRPPSPLTEDEVVVVEILRQFTELSEESQRQWLPEGLVWGNTKKRRQIPFDDRPILGRRRQPNKEKASSPTTPLSFSNTKLVEPTTARDFMVARPPRKPSALKNAKQHNEWMRVQTQTIAALSAYNVNLERAVAEARGRKEALKDKNSHLRYLQSNGGRWHTQQPPQPHGVETRVLVGPTNQVGQGQWEHAGHVPAGLGLGLTLWPPHVVAGGVITAARAGVMVPDLNVTLEEAAVVGVESNSRAAMSAQARKRRRELQKRKSKSSSLHPPHVRGLSYQR